jgi:ATP-dependent RNA helicase RhlE
MMALCTTLLRLPSTLHTQVLNFRGGCDIIVATPGRLLEHVMMRKSVKLDRVEKLVLDEADCMLDLGMEQDLKRWALAC